jgi:predicted CxxxxCH...CXXCH cytochrome family protein
MRLIITMVLFLAVLAFPVCAEECATCHPLPQDSSHKAHASLQTLTPAYGAAGLPPQSALRSDTYAFNCGNCHPQDPARHNNGTLDIELSSEHATGLKALNGKEAAYSKGTKTCSGVYCHSSGGKKEFLEYRVTPAWGTSFDEFRCQACHGSPPSYKNRPGKENSHFNAQTPAAHLLGIHWDATNGHTKESFANRLSSNMGCSTCHYKTVREDRDTTFVDSVSGLFTCSRCHDDRKVMGKNRTGAIADKTLHVNGIAEVAFKPEKFRTTARLMQVPKDWVRTGEFGDPKGYDETLKELNSAQYVQEEKKCLNVACHLSGTEVRWGEKLTCASCHKDFLQQ